MTALSLLSTISTYFAFLFAFPIVCRCFLERFCVAQQIKASNPGVFCSVVGWPGRLYWFIYARARRRKSIHTKKTRNRGPLHEWVHISMSNGYMTMNNSTNVVFPFTFIFTSNHESRRVFLRAYFDWLYGLGIIEDKKIAKKKKRTIDNERIWRSVLNYLNLHLCLFATSRMNYYWLFKTGSITSELKTPIYLPKTRRFKSSHNANTKNWT